MGLTAATYAQTTHPGVGADMERAKFWQKQLNLTDKQTEKIAAIYKETLEYCEKMKRVAHGNSNKMSNSIRPLRAATIKKVRSVLTPDQAAKYDVLVKQTKNGGFNDCVSAIN
jgi:Spy/CpxP family protein refolding chaperone